MALPRPCPILAAFSDNQAFPVLFHQASKGSAIILSQARLTFSPKDSASFHSWEFTRSLTVFRRPSILSMTHLLMLAPASFQASPHSATVSWFSSSQVVTFSRPGLTPSHRPSPQFRIRLFWIVSFMVLIMPLAVLDWFAIMPPNRLSMPVRRAWIATEAFTLSFPMLATCSAVRPSSC